MRQIDALELIGQGYSWEQDWEQQLGKAYGWPSVCLALVFFGAGAAVVLELISPTTAAVVMISTGAAMILLTVLAFRSTPRSPVTGKRLVKYRNLNPLTERAAVEVVYVDHETRKFFVYAWMKNAEALG